MTALYLVTGFLGAGKTTFLSQFTREFSGKKLAILVNEFGKAGIDGALLADCAAIVSEIAGGSIFCTCKLDTFEKELLALLDQKPDVVLVEASGLSDPTSIWKLLKTRPCFSVVDYKGCICLCDAVTFPKVFATARPCRKQLSVADLVILGKIDLASKEQLEKTYQTIGQQRPDAPIYETSFGSISQAILPKLLNPKRTAHENITTLHSADLTLRSVTLQVSETMGSGALSKFLQMFCEDCYRIKGIVKLADGLFHVDCVGSFVQVLPKAHLDPTNNHMTALYTSAQPCKKSIQTAMEWYPNLVTFVE